MSEDTTSHTAAFSSGPSPAIGDIHDQEPTEDAVGQIQKVRAGQWVESHFGRQGRVSRLLRDRESREVTHFVVGTRRFLGRELIVPAEWAAEVEGDHVLLRADAEGFDRLPVYRTDEEIDGDVERSLSQDEGLQHLGRMLLSVSVQDGVVTLRGYVPDQRGREQADEVTSGTRGVRGLRDQLVADDDLEVRVARALANDDRTRPYVIRVYCHKVYCHNGIAHLTGTLEGTVASAEIQVIAQEIAANVAGVRLAVAEFDGRNSGDQASPILPGVGLPVYVTDGHLGQLESVVMSPRSRRVTHLIVGLLPEAEASYLAPESRPETRRLLIPAAAVSHVTENAVLLGLDRATAGRLPVYSGDRYRLPESDWQTSFDYSRADVRYPVEAPRTRQSEQSTVEAAAA